MTRRDFFRFFVVGGVAGLAMKNLRIKREPKKARFWKKIRDDKPLTDTPENNT